MALASFKPSLKRQRSNTVDNDSTRTMAQRQKGRVLQAKKGVRACYDWRQLISERTVGFVPRSSRSNYKRSRGRVIQNQPISFQDILITFTILFLSSGSIFRFVNGEADHHIMYSDEKENLQIRGNLNGIWEEGEHMGNEMFLKDERGTDTLLMYSKQTQKGGYAQRKGRELEGELGKFIIQQNATNNTEGLVPTVRNNIDSQKASESNVTSFPSTTLPPVNGLIDSKFIKGNPLIQSTLRINFKVELIVRDTITNNLLKELETTLENYIQTEYQQLVDRGRVGNKDTLKLGVVDLTLSLIESMWLQDRRRRRLSYTSIERNMQAGREKLMIISVNGSLYYAMEVDGSTPTPDDIEREWTEAYVTITSQNQLQRAIENAAIDGVVRLQQVTNLNSDETSNTGSGSTNNGDISSLYDNDGTTGNSNSSPSETANGSSNESSETYVEKKKNSIFSSKKGAPLQRPSTLSIIFGFILTGIAVLGLFGYAYLYCRHRKKQAKKRKKMKESITFSSPGAAAAAAAAVSNRNQNSLYYSKNGPQSTPPPRSSSQVYLNSMMLSQTQSEETTYGGIESSVGSEDTSDPFAHELKLAASLDQEAWDESQRRKEELEKRQAARMASNAPAVSTNQNPTTNSMVPSLLSKGGLTLEEEDDVEGSAIETGLEGSTAWVQSYPYGDENERFGGGNRNQPKIPSSDDKWEPYNSALPPLVEEKKDETNPSEFFAQKLKNIQNDLSQSSGKSNERSRTEPSVSDDVSDILSEVSEISKYVRRYERRKDRKIKREENIQERLDAFNGAASYPSPATQPISTGMDGRVPKAQNDEHDRTGPPQNERLEPYPLSSYAGSFRNARKQEAIQESLSVISDEADEDAENSLRSQRLGISPYQRSNDEIYYENGKLRNQENSLSNRSATTSTRTRSTRSEEDYRYTVGYTMDRNRSSSARLAHLRANDAIIDNSNSEINVPFSKPQISSTSNPNSLASTNKGTSMAENTKPVITPRNEQQSIKPRPPGKQNRFAKLRGIFEQKTNEQPAPIYPPGANWQNGGSLGK